MINILVAITSTLAQKIRNNWATINDDVKQILRNNGKPKWTSVTLNTKTYIILDLIVDETELAIVEAKLSNAGNNGRIIGAWNEDGSQYGTTFVYDIDGNRTITGSPTYPIPKAKLKAAMPPIITYDGDGNEIPVPQTVLSDFLGHVWAGWGVRDYTA